MSESEIVKDSNPTVALLNAILEKDSAALERLLAHNSLLNADLVNADLIFSRSQAGADGGWNHTMMKKGDPIPDLGQD